MRWLYALTLSLLLLPSSVSARLSKPITHCCIRHLGLVWTTGYLWTNYRTASGVWPVAGRTVAVDTRIIPMGAWVHISGIGWRHAEDTGGAIIGTRLDVFVSSMAAVYKVTGWHQAYYVLAVG